jgi:hypothetical protein
VASRSANIVFDILAKDNASKVFDKMSDKLNAQERALDGLRKAGTAQFFALAVSAGIFAKESIGAARDLGETVNMAGIIFGEQADEMEAWAETANRSVGMSKQAALEATASFGDMYTQLGLTGDVAASMSQETVQLSADLGSFRNLPTEDVLDRISGAMRGEYDSLQKLIPNISTARVQQEALAASGKTVASELTEQEKVTATLAIIQNDAKNATGDFARTSGDLANQQKTLGATTENLAAKAGEDLLPIVLDLTSAAVDTLSWMTEHEAATKAIVISVATLSTTLAVAANWQKITATTSTLAAGAEWAWNGARTTGNVLLGRSLPLKAADAQATATSTAAIGSLTATTAANTQATVVATTATKGHAAALKSLSKGGVVVGGVVLGLTAIAEGMNAVYTSNQSLADVTKGVLALGDATAEASAGIDMPLWYDMEQTLDLIRRETTGLGGAMTDISNIALFGQADKLNGLDAARSKFDDLGESLASIYASNPELAAERFDAILTETGGTTDELLKLMPAYADALTSVENDQKIVASATDDANLTTEEQAEAMGDAADAVMTLVEALEEQIDKQREAAGAVLDESAAVREFYDTTASATAALEENGKTLDVHTEKGRENQAALDEIASSTWDWIDAGVKAGESQFVLTGRMAEGRQAFIDTATQMGATSTEAEAYADELGLIPTAIVTDISLSGASDAYRYITNIQAALRSITGDHRIRVATGQGGSGGLTFAGGGPVHGPGTWTSDSIPAWLSDNEYVQSAPAHDFWGTDYMDAVNRKDVSGVLNALIGAGYAAGGTPAVTGLSASSAMLRPYVGLSASSTSSNPVSSGSAVFHLYDSDGVLMGTMRGAADDSARFTQQTRSATLRGGGRR